MASFDVALNWTLNFEDSQRQYAVVNDVGGIAIAGINSRSFPTDCARIAALPQDQRAEPVAKFYQVNFWNQWYQQIASDEVAKRVFDMAVNGGTGAAVKCLQRAISDVMGEDEEDEHACTVDGKWGPDTIGWANALNKGWTAEELVSAFKQLRGDHYRAIVSNNPEMAKYLNVWLARAEA